MPPPERGRLDVYQTLFLRELAAAAASAEEQGTFVIERSPGFTVFARRARLLGVVVYTETMADGRQWLVIDDSTATCGVSLLRSTPPTPSSSALAPGLGDLLEVIGELVAGSGPSSVTAVHIDCCHFKTHTDPFYELSRWQTLRRQRQEENEGAAHAIPLRTESLATTCQSGLPSASKHDAGAQDGIPPTSSQGAAVEMGDAVCQGGLRFAVLTCLASGGGVSLDELEANVAPELLNRVTTGENALLDLLADLEEEFVVYRNQDRYLML